MPEHSFTLLFTAEHASNAIPARYGDVAKRAGAVLKTHRGYDPGSALLARKLARAFKAPLVMGRYSRLLIELNRSPHHPQLWSEYSQTLDAAQKREILGGYYQPYRDTVAAQIKALSRDGGPVLHLSVHSFTPQLDGEVRTADIGLLYDPAREPEARICARWKKTLKEQSDSLWVRRNYPYLGIADGLVTHLRGQLGAETYAGVELEVNQQFPLGSVARWNEVQNQIVRSLAEALACSGS